MGAVVFSTPLPSGGEIQQGEWRLNESHFAESLLLQYCTYRIENLNFPEEYTCYSSFSHQKVLNLCLCKNKYLHFNIPKQMNEESFIKEK